MYRKEFEINRPFPKKIYITLVILTFLTNVAIQPYQLALQGKAFEPDKLLNYAWLVLLNTIIYSIFAGIGLYLATRIGLGLPFLEGLYPGDVRWKFFKPVLSLSIILVWWLQCWWSVLAR